MSTTSTPTPSQALAKVKRTAAKMAKAEAAVAAARDERDAAIREAYALGRRAITIDELVQVSGIARAQVFNVVRADTKGA